MLGISYDDQMTTSDGFFDESSSTDCLYHLVLDNGISDGLDAWIVVCAVVVASEVQGCAGHAVEKFSGSVNGFLTDVWRTENM